MESESSKQLQIVFDVDLAGVLSDRGMSPTHTSYEADRIGLCYRFDAVESAQRDLSNGKAPVEVRAWSATIRRMHSDYLSAAAKTAMSSLSRGGNFNVS